MATSTIGIPGEKSTQTRPTLSTGGYSNTSLSALSKFHFQHDLSGADGKVREFNTL